MDKLDKNFPNKATAMSGMNEMEKIAYIAQIELINTIEMWNEPKKDK